ncbi:MAG: class I SAM-dependent methyltransferase [Acidobacteriota bacterium]|nr:class I SAM-dependent methyltransferase [Acidobacteriota bacterium]
MSDPEENERLWGNYSLANELSPAQRHRWRLVVRELEGLPERAMVVDIGCGSGALLERIGHTRPDARLAGIDVEPSALALAKRRLPAATFVRGDLDQDTGAVKAFRERADAVVCSEVIEHLAAPERALRLARELLRPGGRLIVTVPAGPMNDFDRSIGHKKHYRLDELTGLLSGAGFEIVRAAAWGFPFHTLFRIALAMAPRATGRFTDEKIGLAHRSLFSLLNVLFYLNLRSRRWGRQLIVTATMPTAV